MDTNLSFPDRIRRISMLSWLVIPSLAVFFTVQFFQTQVLSIQTQNHNQLAAPTTLPEVTAEFAVPAEVPTWEQYQGKPSGLVSFWFDGGWSSEYDFAYPILKEYEYPGTVAVPTSSVDTNQNVITSPKLLELQENKWEVSSFTQTASCDLLGNDETVFETEIAESKKELMRHGLAGNLFTAPCQLPTVSVLPEIQQRYDGQKISEEGLNSLPLDDKYRLKTYVFTQSTTYSEVASWLRKAKKEHSWLILTVNQVSDNPTDAAIAPEKFSRIVAMVNQQKLPVVTPSQVITITDWGNN